MTGSRIRWPRTTPHSTRAFDQAAAAFSEDVVYAVPRPGAHEVGLRNVVEGRPLLRDYFEGRGVQPHRHRILLSAVEGSSCLLEGVTEDAASGSALRTFMASLRLDAQGLITRYLAYQCEPPVSPGPTEGRKEVAGAAALVERYFQALAEGSFEEAASCFSRDVIYSHPPNGHIRTTDNPRLSIEGGQALLETLRRRGRTGCRHWVDLLLERGANALFEGVVTDLPGGGVGGTLASLSLDAGGLIDRYVTFSCEPAVPRG